jgi:hypothetical protein
VSTARKHILKSLLILPVGAPPELNDPSILWCAVQDAERRKDATEGRWLTLTLPRCLPQDAHIRIMGIVAGRFASMGVPVQADLHCPPAGDGEDNPHAHILLGERAIVGGRFEAIKCEALIRFFRQGYGRPLRVWLAIIVNAVAAEFGFEAPIVSPDRQSGDPEIRLPREVFTHQSETDKDVILALQEARSAKRKLMNALVRLEGPRIQRQEQPAPENLVVQPGIRMDLLREILDFDSQPKPEITGISSDRGTFFPPQAIVTKTERNRYSGVADPVEKLLEAETTAKARDESSHVESMNKSPSEANFSHGENSARNADEALGALSTGPDRANPTIVEDEYMEQRRLEPEIMAATYYPFDIQSEEDIEPSESEPETEAPKPF